MALPEPVGEIEERVGVEAVHRLHDHVDAALDPHLGLDVLRDRAGSRPPLQLLAQLLDLRAHHVELRGARVQEGVRLARGDRLDPAGARPDRPSERIANAPISAVVRTCVPPQSSRETPCTSTTRTMSPYFSPKSIVAPSLRASSIGVSNVITGMFSKIRSLTTALDLARARPR